MVSRINKIIAVSCVERGTDESCNFSKSDSSLKTKIRLQAKLNKIAIVDQRTQAICTDLMQIQWHTESRYKAAKLRASS